MPRPAGLSRCESFGYNKGAMPHRSRASFLLLLCAAFSVALPGSRALAAPVAERPPDRDREVQAVVDGVSRDPLERVVRALASFPTRHTLSGAGGVDAAADYLYREFSAIAAETGGALKVEKDTWTQEAGNRIPAPTQLTNVVATLPGTERPDTVIVITGHYDSRASDVMDVRSPAPGANDDASGVAAVVETARRMAGRKYPVTVIFAAVTGEEQGLYGSTHLAKKLAAEKKTVLAMLANDIVGNSRGQDGRKNDKQVRVFSAGYDPSVTPEALARARSWGTDADTPARTLARAVRDAARRYVKGFEAVLVYRNDRYGRGGDHTPFLNHGFPSAVRLTEPNEDWRRQHQDIRVVDGVQYGDLPQFVDYDYLQRVARVNAAIVAELATAPPPPPRVSLKGDLSPETTLTWELSPGAAEYEVLWRRTTAADWEGRRRVETGNTVRLPLSKDDYLFAVRAVGPSGARGLPTIPVAGR